MEDKLSQVIENFEDKKLLVVGDVVLDRYVAGTVDRVNPEAPVLILSAHYEKETTGGAGNAAKNAAMLGATTTLISVVGDDAMADRIESAATKEGYNARFIKDADRPTISKTRFLAKIRESEALADDPIEGSQQLLRVDWEDRNEISGDVEAQVIAAIQDAAKNGIDGILVSDYNKGVITKNVAAAIMEVAQAHNITIAADLKPSNGPLFAGVDIISPNRKEAHEYLGIDPIAEPKNPEELASQLRDMMKSNVFVTLGPDGMFVNAGDVREHVPQEHVVKVYDVSGAGDTAVVTLLLSKIAGANPVEAARIANAAGAFVVSKVGTVGLTRDDLRGMLLHRNK